MFVNELTVTFYFHHFSHVNLTALLNFTKYYWMNINETWYQYYSFLRV